MFLPRRQNYQGGLTSCSAAGVGAVSHANVGAMSVQALPDWLAELQLTNLDVSFCKGCNISVVSTMTSLQVLSLQVGFAGLPQAA